MRFFQVLVLVGLGLSQDGFAQKADGVPGCCIKLDQGASGVCIYHAVLPNLKCPAGFDWDDSVKGEQICPKQGAAPVRDHCPF